MAYSIQDVRQAAGDGDYDEDLARWLEESGRRRSLSRKMAEGTDIETTVTAANDARPLPLRRLLLATVFALSAAQYLYADVHLSIYRLPSLVVFAAPAPQ